MKVALIGATGRVGSHLLAELLARDHVVTGIVHTAAPIEPTPTLSIAIADARDASALAPALVGHDAVISASRFVSSDANALISALKQARVGRLMAVGGAGSLEVAPGQALADSPGFPEAFRAEAEAGRAFLAVLRAKPTLDWTCLSPSADFAPGMRTGHGRITVARDSRWGTDARPSCPDEHEWQCGCTAPGGAESLPPGSWHRRQGRKARCVACESTLGSVIVADWLSPPPAPKGPARAGLPSLAEDNR